MAEGAHGIHSIVMISRTIGSTRLAQSRHQQVSSVRLSCYGPPDYQIGRFWHKSNSMSISSVACGTRPPVIYSVHPAMITQMHL